MISKDGSLKMIIDNDIWTNDKREWEMAENDNNDTVFDVRRWKIMANNAR